MILPKLQTCLWLSGRDPETNEYMLTPTDIWRTVVEFEEGELDNNINSFLQHQIELTAKCMNLPVEEVRNYYRIKEIK